uniref:NTR domain-containing protein-like n=1 Tax=Crassostrea virginica TaxID=6565 RepID=A0A8B8B3I6_CRAVI|nr:NTR domain-containing protein-like [Crassostrea virginica]
MGRRNIFLVGFAIACLCASVVYSCKCDCNDFCICSCEEPTPVNGCKAEFSLRGVVVMDSIVQISGLLKRQYIIDVLQYYKKPKGFKHQVKLMTSIDKATCGVSLQIGEIYVLSGSVTGKQLESDQCQYNRLYSSVPIWHRANLFC